jgi:hypothetical protein
MRSASWLLVALLSCACGRPSTVTGECVVSGDVRASRAEAVRSCAVFADALEDHCIAIVGEPATYDAQRVCEAHVVETEEGFTFSLETECAIDSCDAEEDCDD